MKIKLLLVIALFTFRGLFSQSLYFPPVSGNTWDTISPKSLNWCQPNIDSLYSFLEANNTKAFVLLKDGKIVLEKYFGSHTQTSAWYWASAGKTLTAFMIGIAQQEKYLSIYDTTSKYLGKGWTTCSPAQEEKITIRHQLTMTTGLDDGVPDHHCTLDTCLVYKADAGTRWAYHNGPYTLLDSVIKVATGVNISTYVNQKLKIPTGITGLFVKSGYDNVFYSNARSMARFGLLLLNNGNWDGKQILNTDYFNEMTHSSQSINPAYGYLSWLNGSSKYMIPQTQLVFKGPLSPNAPTDMFVAMGKNGQFINVVPSRNLVWIRMGDAPDNSEVPFLLNDQIWEHLNVLECKPLGIGEMERNSVSVFPNPAQDKLNILSSATVSEIELYNLQGKSILKEKILEKDKSISLKDLAKGMYFIKITLEDNRIVVRKMFKE